MSTEQLPIPSALELGFPDRVLEYLTNQNKDRIVANAVRAGIVANLGQTVSEHLTDWNIDTIGKNASASGIIDGAEAKPWSALMQVTDSITAAESVRIERPDTNSLPLTNTLVRFDSTQGRERFNYLIESVLAGIPTQRMSRIRIGGPRELVLHDFPYADNASLGRLATATMRKQYEHLGPYRRGFVQSTIANIQENDMIHLPPELQERAKHQKEALGADTLLSSGNISIIGKAMREALQPTDEELRNADGQEQLDKLVGELLQLQRPPSDRPYLEARTRFISNGGTIPISRSTVGSTIGDQLGSRGREYKKTVDDRDWTKFAQDIWDLATGMGVTQGIGAGVRAVGTLFIASVASTSGMIADGHRRRKIQKQTKIAE